MMTRGCICWSIGLLMLSCVAGSSVNELPRRLLVDTDVDTDDLFAILYLLKLNKSEFNLQGITITANLWSNAGHAVNHIYDILYMMDRDDVLVGVGGEGGIREDGTIMPDVGGFIPLIDQGMSTVGGCRYRQAVPVGTRDQLQVDTNFGFRKGFLPQGGRGYSPVSQPTAQQVLIEKISQGPITIFAFGALTNIAIFLMSNPQLKTNIEHIYIMGGAVRPKNTSDCCPKSSSSCIPKQCGEEIGNLYIARATNPYAEFNMFGDPFAAYQVFHAGIPITLIPLDATNTIPVTEKLFEVFQENQDTYEAQYIFQSLKMIRDTYPDYHSFYTGYYMWDSFTAGVAISIMRNASHNPFGENEFSSMEFMNLTVVTSNEPYGLSDGSNPLFDGCSVPKFGLKKNCVHSGHVQRSIHDPFCLGIDGIGKCQDGRTKETTGPDSVSVLVATKAKPNKDIDSSLNREYYKNFLDVINKPQHSGRFNFTSQFPCYEATLYKSGRKSQGRPIVFDMDMSVGDFVALFYLLKVPMDEIDIKAIFVSPTGWANAATIDAVYDLLHMMGRDDILVGLGDLLPLNQSDLCYHSNAIPQGGGGFLDSDTLYEFARNFPRSPRRYTAENSVEFGAPRDTDHPELRQPFVLEIWDSIVQSLRPGSKITILSNGPLTSLAKIILMKQNTLSLIQDVYIVGGHLGDSDMEKGNVFTIPSNKYAEMNMFLDPIAAQTVFNSELNITLIPLIVQRSVSSFPEIIRWLNSREVTPEANFTRQLMSMLYELQLKHHRYKHMETFLGEILGAVVIGGDTTLLNLKLQTMPVKVTSTGDEANYGQTDIDYIEGKTMKILVGLNSTAYYGLVSDRLSSKDQSAVVGSFEEQKAGWSEPCDWNLDASI